MAIVRISEPTSEPVSLDLAKLHLGVETSDYDDLIELYIKSARAHVENITHRVIVDSNWDVVLDEFPDGEIRIPTWPLIAITSVKYDDSAGTETTFATSGYTTNLTTGWVIPKTAGWPTPRDATGAIRVRINAGWTVATVPAPIIAAILLEVGNRFEFRESDNADALQQTPNGFEALVGPYTIPVIA